MDGQPDVTSSVIEVLMALMFAALLGYAAGRSHGERAAREKQQKETVT